MADKSKPQGATTSKTQPTPIKPVKIVLDTKEQIAVKAKKLASVIRESKYVVAFTGQALSSSNTANAAVAVAQSPANTKAAAASGADARPPSRPTSQRQHMLYHPTVTHMALAKLVEAGLIKHIITTTVEGFHQRSGVPDTAVTELLGNTHLEYCKTCHTQHWRRQRTREKSHGVRNQRTGHKCVKCGKELVDNLGNSGEPLEQGPLEMAQAQIAKADLVLVIGSRAAPPAGNVVFSALEAGHRVVALHNQATDVDEDAAMKIAGTVEDCMAALMVELKLPVPAPLDRLETLVGNEAPPAEVESTKAEEEDAAVDVSSKLVGQISHRSRVGSDDGSGYVSTVGSREARSPKPKTKKSVSHVTISFKVETIGDGQSDVEQDPKILAKRSFKISHRAKTPGPAASRRMSEQNAMLKAEASRTSLDHSRSYGSERGLSAGSRNSVDILSVDSNNSSSTPRLPEQVLPRLNARSRPSSSKSVANSSIPPPMMQGPSPVAAAIAAAKHAPPAAVSTGSHSSRSSMTKLRPADIRAAALQELHMNSHKSLAR